MARVPALTMGPRPCHRHAQCTRARVTATLTLLAAAVTVPDLVPSLLFASPLRSRKQAAPAVQRNVFIGGRIPVWAQTHSWITRLAEYDSMKVAELKALLKGKGLPVTGTKAVLISRLKEAGGETGKEDPKEKEEEEEEEAAPKKKKLKKKKKKIVKKKKSTEETAPPTLDDEPAAEEQPEKEEHQEETKSDQGQTAPKPGDRVEARYHRDDRTYPGILLSIQYDGRYLVSWDEPDENEPLTSVTKVTLLKKAKVPLEDAEKQIYHVGDKIWARFPSDNNFYDADLLELNGNRCKIKWQDPDGSPPTAEMPVHDIKLKLRTKSAC